MKAAVSDVLIDLDYSLSVCGVLHREMEMADAYYMIRLHNERHKKIGFEE